MSTMGQTPLLLHRLLDRGPRLNPHELVVTKITNGYHRITLAEHQIRSYMLASALSKFGVKIGDRIGSFLWNTARHLQCYHAIPCMGAVLHTINIRLNPKEIGYLISHAQDRILIVDADLLPSLEAVPAKDIEQVELFIICGTDEKPGGWKTNLPANKTVDWDEFVATGDKFYQWPEIDENSPMGLCYTSGTTGNPKGVAYSHRSTYLHTISAALPDCLSVSATDIILPVVPMFHAQAWGLPFMALTLVTTNQASTRLRSTFDKLHKDGARLCQINRFMTPEKTLEFMMDEGTTLCAGVPTIWQNIRSALQANPSWMKKLKVRRLVTGGSAPPVELLLWYASQLGVDFAQVWGMTETNPLATISNRIGRRSDLEKTPENQFVNITKAGLVVPGLEIKIVDSADLDKKLPHDGEATGELLVRGPWVNTSYFHDPAEDKFHKGWLITGDMASIDSEGYLIIRDRSKDLIKSGGEWISSVDLENHICAYKGVSMACVVAQPHPKWDERPIAIVVVSPGVKITKEAIIKHCANKFAKFQLPDDILFWESIPLTSTGKLSKKDVRAKLKQLTYTLPSLARSAL